MVAEMKKLSIMSYVFETSLSGTKAKAKATTRTVIENSHLFLNLAYFFRFLLQDKTIFYFLLTGS